MPVVDELQLVAQARAAMMMRGFMPLRLECGPAMARALRPHMAEDDTVLEMPVTVLTEMEGFAVRGPEYRGSDCG